MKYRLRTLLILLAVGPPVLAGAWFMPFRGFATNCGGNNAARNYVREYALMMIMFADESPTQEFSLASATVLQRGELATGPSGWGVSHGDILICTKPLGLDPSISRRIIVACNRPFTNVPQYAFHSAPRSHAVAFSDGSTALLSESGFAAIDRASFIAVSEINNSTP
jgi:hypothetical protein